MMLCSCCDQPDWSVRFHASLVVGPSIPGLSKLCFLSHYYHSATFFIRQIRGILTLWDYIKLNVYLSFMFVYLWTAHSKET